MILTSFLLALGILSYPVNRLLIECNAPIWVQIGWIILSLVCCVTALIRLIKE